MAALTWSVLAAELGIAVLVLSPGRGRIYALALAVALHSAIIVVMGLASFGLTMIALVAVSCGRPRSGARGVPDPREGEDDEHPSVRSVAGVPG